MKIKFLARNLLLLFGIVCVHCEGETHDDFVESDSISPKDFQPFEDEMLNKLTEKDDGPFARKIKKLVAKYLLATAIDSATNSSIKGRTLLQNYYPNPAQPRQQQQQPQIVYVYGTPPPQNSNERTRRTRPPRTMRTRRPGHHHHHQSSEERATQAPPQQPIYVQQPIQSGQYPPQPYPPQQPSYNPQYPQQQQPNPQHPVQQQQPYPAQQPPAYPQPQPPQQQRPQQQVPILEAPQDSLTSQGGQSFPSSQNNLAQSQTPPASQNPYPPQQPKPQQAAPQRPVQVVYIQPTTKAPPPTTRRPGPSQEHVYNQVNKILDNVAVGNVTGIVDQALGIRAPMPTRNFVNGILNTVFCSPINRLLGRCRGPS